MLGPATCFLLTLGIRGSALEEPLPSCPSPLFFSTPPTGRRAPLWAWLSRLAVLGVKVCVYVVAQSCLTLYPSRLLCPWDSPGKNSGSESEVTQSCLTPCDLMDCSLPGSSVHGIFQARILECVAIPFSRGPSQPRY